MAGTRATPAAASPTPATAVMETKRRKRLGTGEGLPEGEQRPDRTAEDLAFLRQAASAEGSGSACTIASACTARVSAMYSSRPPWTSV